MNSPDEPVDFENPLDLEDPEKIQPVKKPIAGFILSIIGSALILMFALTLVYTSLNPSLIEGQLETAFTPSSEQMGNMTSEELFAFSLNMIGMLGIFGLVCGILIIVGGLLAYYKGMKVAGGVIIIIFSILSIFSFGGFFIGMILGIIGGGLVLMTK